MQINSFLAKYSLA